MSDTMKTLGIAMFVSVFGVGSFLRNILISVTKKLGGRRWFVNNMNKAHLYYFYWLLASLSAINFCVYMLLASRYKYKNAQNNIPYQEESRMERTLLTSRAYVEILEVNGIGFPRLGHGGWGRNLTW